jgi:hypothetical protein
LAKKKKHGERVSFRFDERAGRDEKTIDLFGPDEDELLEEPESEGETPSERFRVPKSFDTPLEDEDEAPEKPKKADKPSDTPTFRFDRYGRRIGKRAHYGKRKDAPRATTTVVEHDTEAKREYEEARRRSEARAKRRAREEAKAAELKKAQRKEKWRRSAATFALGILALVVLALLAWFTTRLNKIEITNIPQGYTEEHIIELSGLEPSLNKKSALFISTKKVEDRIRQDPYLEATVRYSFPSKIRITLSKREEAACVLWGPVNEYLAIIDKNGIVLNDRAETANGLLIAEGMSISSAVNGSRLGDSSDTRVEALIRLLQKLNDRDLMNRTPRINRIDMTELMQIRMYLEGMPNYTIELGSVSLLDSSLDRLQRNWSEIMRYASEQTQGGAMNVTIYLYGKDGPYVSPYEPGYVTPTQAPVSPRPSASPGSNPESTPNPGPEETPYEPQPQVTPMPHQDEPFTG